MMAGDAGYNFVSDDRRVMCRVSATQLVFDANIDGKRPISGRLSVGQKPGVASCWLIGEADPGEVAAGGKEEYLFVVRVRLLRDYGLDVLRDPERGSFGHCNIIGARDTSRANLRRLLRQVRWVRGYAPEGVPADTDVTIGLPRAAQSFSLVNKDKRRENTTWDQVKLYVIKYLPLASIVAGILFLPLARWVKGGFGPVWLTNFDVAIAALSGGLLGAGVGVCLSGLRRSDQPILASIAVSALGVLYVVIAALPVLHNASFEEWSDIYLAIGSAFFGGGLGAVLTHLSAAHQSGTKPDI